MLDSDKDWSQRLAELFGKKIIPKAVLTGHLILMVEYLFLVISPSPIWMFLLNGIAVIFWLWLYSYVDWESLGETVEETAEETAEKAEEKKS